jgi:Smg protein
MKENVLDVLMYLFENYMDSDTEIDPDQETLKADLQDAGFPHVEISKAFDWLEGLAQSQASARTSGVLAERSLRMFTEEETERLDVECRGFLLFLEQSGILDPASRELVIERVMALETEEIDLDQLKWVILLVLFNQPGQEAAYAWMEELVFDNMAGSLH